MINFILAWVFVIQCSVSPFIVIEGKDIFKDINFCFLQALIIFEIYEIRFAKQAFDMENIRLLTYKPLQNMYLLLMAALAFNMTFLSLKTKLQIIFTKALQATKTVFGVPDFHYYTLASGIVLVFKRAPKPHSKPPNPSQYYLNDHQICRINFLRKYKSFFLHVVFLGKDIHHTSKSLAFIKKLSIFFLISTLRRFFGYVNSPHFYMPSIVSSIEPIEQYI